MNFIALTLRPAHFNSSGFGIARVAAVLNRAGTSAKLTVVELFPRQSMARSRSITAGTNPPNDVPR